MARLQRRRGVQAGTGCHEGGIIRSKKPPEWHLPLPQPSSRYDEPHPILVFVVAKKNGPPAAWSWDAGRDRMPEGGIILSKKPPEWHLPLPQPSSRYDVPHPILIFVAAKKNGQIGRASCRERV